MDNKAGSEPDVEITVVVCAQTHTHSYWRMEWLQFICRTVKFGSPGGGGTPFVITFILPAITLQMFARAREFRECVMRASRPVSAAGLWVTTWFSPSNFFPSSFFFRFLCLVATRVHVPRGGMKLAVAYCATSEGCPQLTLYIFNSVTGRTSQTLLHSCVFTCVHPADENKNIPEACRLVLRAWRSSWGGTWLAGKARPLNEAQRLSLLLHLKGIWKLLFEILKWIRSSRRQKKSHFRKNCFWFLIAATLVERKQSSVWHIKFAINWCMIHLTRTTQPVLQGKEQVRTQISKAQQGVDRS